MPERPLLSFSFFPKVCSHHQQTRVFKNPFSFSRIQNHPVLVFFQEFNLIFMAASADAANFGGKTSVRIVVVGDRGTGKSSLIVTAAADSFPDTTPPVLPPTRLPPDFYPDRVPITIIDTSSSPEHRSRLGQELKLADAVVLTYACDEPATLDRLSTYWLPELRRLDVKVPVIVVGCKLDLREEQQVSLELVMSPIMQQFREIETCIECSALKQIQVMSTRFYNQCHANTLTSG
ncbi:mitochondrial Rho GTPase 1-like [Magnolia sinica]|uniref:mitochondrial Rho GTPase 1-like n=1 Tax=Magnolia sinica TaxID=86752 RepID=UPI002659A8D0|nr:mitochondrial Rho GTPase 1-like [Magnolia sinica]